MTETLCPWDPATYLIFSENVPPLLFYSHFTALISIVIIVGAILFFSRKTLSTRILNIIFLLFAAWVLLDLIAWATNSPVEVMFSWSTIVLIEPIIFVASFYLLYAFIHEKLPAFAVNLLFFILLLPLLTLAHTSHNLSGINLYDCVADEGILALYYSYFIEIVSFSLILGVFIVNVARKEGRDRRKTVLFGLGLLLFLLAFSSGNILGSFGGTSYDWEIAQYGLFGMPIFMGLFAYLIVQYRIYNLNILGAQALVITLWLLIGSLLLVAQSTPTMIVSGVTLLLVTIFGFMLIRSVKREVKQREEIERLATDLKKANDRLKVLDKMKSEFVSIASHQLRSPITTIRGYVSMLLEGSYGKFPEKAQNVLQNINEASKYMAMSIEDYLNVSRIEAGNMKYEYSDFNLKEEAERVTNELKPIAAKKNLALTFSAQCSGSGLVHADIGKTRQVIMNLIDNAIKYTEKGGISVLAHDDVKKGKMWISIEDTGIGMDEQTLGEVFEKFIRAKNANEINVTGTGLGLYVAKKMITEMNGRVWAESEGHGKGSIFHIELPLVKSK